MKFHRLACLLLVPATAFLSACHSDKNFSQTSHAGPSTATNPTDDSFFPIMAWNGVPGDPAVLKEMKDCGLTVAGFVAPKDLDACYAAGLRAIVSDARTSGYDWTNVNDAVVRSNVTSLIAQTVKHPAVYGYY